MNELHGVLKKHDMCGVLFVAGPAGRVAMRAQMLASWSCLRDTGGELVLDLGQVPPEERHGRLEATLNMVLTAATALRQTAGMMGNVANSLLKSLGISVVHVSEGSMGTTNGRQTFGNN